MLHLVNLEQSPFGGETYHARRSSLCVLLCHLIEANKANRHNCSSKEEIDDLLQSDDRPLHFLPSRTVKLRISLGTIEKKLPTPIGINPKEPRVAFQSKMA